MVLAIRFTFLTGTIKWLYCDNESVLSKGRAQALPFNFETERNRPMTTPNPNLLNEIALGIYEMEAAETVRKIPLNKLKAAKETFFKRKPDAKGVFVINHYNAAEKEYSCSNWETGAEIFLKAKTPVFVGFTY
jgi:hypothetical protein